MDGITQIWRRWFGEGGGYDRLSPGSSPIAAFGKTRQMGKKHLFMGLACVWVLIFFVVGLNHHSDGSGDDVRIGDDLSGGEYVPTSTTSDDASTSENEEDSTPDTLLDASTADHQRRFVVLIPADSSSPNLCKTIFSALALGYPPPHIVNFDMKPRNNPYILPPRAGANLRKIPGIVRYLEAMMRKDALKSQRLRPNDVVLIVDAWDTWFQLTPDVLLSRYHAINERADERANEEWKKATGSSEGAPWRQRIVGAGQKRCAPGPKSSYNLRCASWPESPMRKDLYGPNTDIIGDEVENMYTTMRPRYINGGAYMGEARDLLKMCRRTLAKMEEMLGQGRARRSEQGFVGEVLGEQFVSRQWALQHHTAIDGGDDDPNNGYSTNMESQMGFMMRHDYEMSMGLDYGRELTVPTVHGHHDGYILSMANTTEIAGMSAALQLSPPRINGIPKDVARSKHPLGHKWENEPLYMDFFMGNIPVAMHHNAWVDGLKDRLFTWWDKTWFFPHLRELVLKSQEESSEENKSREILGVIRTKNGTVAYRTMPMDWNRRRPKLLKQWANTTLQQAGWDQLCPPREGSFEDEWLNGTKWWDEVFRDGKGRLRY